MEARERTHAVGTRKTPKNERMERERDAQWGRVVRNEGNKRESARARISRSLKESEFPLRVEERTCEADT